MKMMSQMDNIQLSTEKLNRKLPQMSQNGKTCFKSCILGPTSYATA